MKMVFDCKSIIEQLVFKRRKKAWDGEKYISITISVSPGINELDWLGNFNQCRKLGNPHELKKVCFNLTRD